MFNMSTLRKNLKKALAGLAFASLLGAEPLLAAPSFEGEVDYRIAVGENDPVTMAEFIKDKKIRVDTAVKDHETITLMDVSAHKAWMLMPKEKMYFATEIPDTTKDKKTKVEGKLTKTGKTATLLGKACEEWLYESSGGQASLWATTAVGAFEGMGDPGEAGNGWADMVKTKGLFPLKIVQRDRSGKETAVMEAIKFEKAPLSSSLFQVPSDYKKMEMNFGSSAQPTKVLEKKSVSVQKDGKK